MPKGTPRARRLDGKPLWRWLIHRATPFAATAIILLALEIVLRAGHVPSYVVPAPSLIIQSMIANHALLWRNATVTMIEATLGFAVGNAVGVLLAIIFLYSRPLERSLFPVAQVVRSIPIVALAPLFLLWFGNGMAPKVITAALICFFPTLVNSYRGLTSVDRLYLELMHTLAASRIQVFRKVLWPAALPDVFGALKIASASAIIGALIAEWVGSDRGLGFLIVNSTYEYKVELLWATICVASLLAVIAFEIIVWIERWSLPWRDADTAET
jgi:NitT/TauT family transport system permease protein